MVQLGPIHSSLLCMYYACACVCMQGGGSTARLGGRELTLLCGFNQYTPLQNRDNISGFLGTPLYCSLKLGGEGGGGGRPCPPVEPPPPPPLVCTVILEIGILIFVGGAFYEN